MKTWRSYTGGGMEIFLQACVNGLLIGGFYSLMGMGQNIIFGVMKIINFCHGEMLMIGMYLTFVFNTFFGIDPYLSIPLVALCMFGLGALIQHTLITPSLGTKSFTNLLFLTVGLGILFQNLALVIFSPNYRTITTSYSSITVHLGPVTMALPKLISFIALIIITIALFWFLKYTSTGKKIRAVSQNPIGAEVVGINSKRIYIITYGLGCALAGVAGALLTLFYMVYPMVGSSFGFKALMEGREVNPEEDQHGIFSKVISDAQKEAAAQLEAAQTESQPETPASEPEAPAAAPEAERHQRQYSFNGQTAAGALRPD